LIEVHVKRFYLLFFSLLFIGTIQSENWLQRRLTQVVNSVAIARNAIGNLVKKTVNFTGAIKDKIFSINRRPVLTNIWHFIIKACPSYFRKKNSNNSSGDKTDEQTSTQETGNLSPEEIDAKGTVIFEFGERKRAEDVAVLENACLVMGGLNDEGEPNEGTDQYTSQFFGSMAEIVGVFDGHGDGLVYRGQPWQTHSMELVKDCADQGMLICKEQKVRDVLFLVLAKLFYLLCRSLFLVNYQATQMQKASYNPANAG